MVSQPLITVIIPFLNAEKFLSEAVASVFAQTYSRWELLLVDDGSTDASVTFARSCATQNPFTVHYLCHPDGQNLGISASRNLGLRHSQGQYIAFLDADDVWIPDTLADQVAVLESYPEAAMVYGPLRWWYSWTGNPEDTRRDEIENLGIDADALIQPPHLLAKFLQNKAAVPSGMLTRREVIEDVGGFEESFPLLYEDQAFISKVCLRYPVFASSKSWYSYRQHPDSCCAVGQKTGAYYDTRPRFLLWLEQHLVDNRAREPELWKVVNREVWPYRHPRLNKMRKWRQQFFSDMKSISVRVAGRLIPVAIRSWLLSRLKGREHRPPLGWVYMGNIRRVTPISIEYGYDRGQPIDRYYIEKYLSVHQADVRGRVLEIADNTYTRRYGNGRVTQSDILHAEEGNPAATLIGDLVTASHIPSDTFDTIILTQTLQVIFDVKAAIRTLARILKPGGVLLATFPGISPISLYDMDRWGYYWSFTSRSAQLLFEDAFPSSHLTIYTYGNVLTATAFLYGLATEELKQDEMDYFDPAYEVIIAVRAQKPQHIAVEYADEG